MSKYFSPAEFKRCVPACSIDDMDQQFLGLLDHIREAAGVPFKLNCAYRSRAYDLAKGRSGNGAHTRGKAVDIKANTSQTRYKIIRAAMELGVNRIGVGNGFIHLDDDKSLPQCVIWHYY